MFKMNKKGMWKIIVMWMLALLMLTFLVFLILFMKDQAMVILGEIF